MLTLVLTIIIKAGTQFEFLLLLAYLGIGAIGFGYSALLKRFNMGLGANLFLLFATLSGVYFYTSMPRGPEGLSQLAAFLGWLLLIAISVILSLAIGLFTRRKR